MKLKQRKEADVKKAVQDYLKLRNFRWFRMQSGQIMGQHKGKPWMMRLCPPGTPDFLVLRLKEGGWANGEYRADEVIVTWLEVKRPLGPKGGTGGSEQNEDQIRFQQEAERNGERYFVVRGVDDLVKAIT